MNINDISNIEKHDINKAVCQRWENMPLVQHLLVYRKVG